MKMTPAGPPAGMIYGEFGTAIPVWPSELVYVVGLRLGKTLHRQGSLHQRKTTPELSPVVASSGMPDRCA